MSAEIHAKYQDLLAKIESLALRQKAMYGEQIRCKVGCFSCCRPPDTLFRVEAEVLRAAVAALGDDEKQRIQERLVNYKEGKRALCPLLEQGGCQVYEARPVICRTHGYSVLLSDEDGSFLSWCELNFDEVSPDAQVSFHVEHLNTVLSVMTRMGWPDDVARPPLVEVVEEALHARISQSPHGGAATLEGESKASILGDEQS